MNFSVVENHSIEAAFYILSITNFLLFIERDVKKYLFFSAVCAALAGLSRYTSYSLALSIGFFLLFFLKKERLLNFILFSLYFSVISSVWWIPNLIMNGSPLATWLYLNIGLSVAPFYTFDWWWEYQNSYDGVLDIIKNHPFLYIENLAKNILKSILLIASSISFLKMKLSIISLILISIFFYKKSIYKKTSKEKSILFIVFSSFVYIFNASNAFVFFEALLPITIPLILITLILIFANTRSHLLINFSLFFIVSNLIYGAYLSSIENPQVRDALSLSTHEKISKVIARDSSDLNVLISSIHPVHGYYQNVDWIIAPLGGVNDFCDIIDYNVSNKVFHYAPKSNFNLNKKDMRLNYILITESLTKIWEFVNDDFTINKNFK